MTVKQINEQIAMLLELKAQLIGEHLLIELPHYIVQEDFGLPYSVEIEFYKTLFSSNNDNAVQYCHTLEEALRD
jgi:hypothetical protein